jgi:hypothetical protein
MANKQAKKNTTTTAFKDMTTPELIVKAKQLTFEISKKRLGSGKNNN